MENKEKPTENEIDNIGRISLGTTEICYDTVYI